MRALILPALLVATPAAALTPEEVWSVWQAQAARWGVPLLVEVERPGDGSLLLRLTAQAPADAPEALAEGSPLREVRLLPQGDGSVLIQGGMGERFDLPVDAEGRALRIEQRGALAVARDGAAGIDYAYDAESVRLVLLPPPDRPYDQGAGEFALEMSEVALRLPARPAEEASFGFDLALSAGGMASVLTIPDPVAGVTSGWSRAEDLSLEVSQTMPAAVVDLLRDLGDGGPESDPAVVARTLAEALTDGAALRLAFASGPGSSGGSATGGVLAYDYIYASGPSRGLYAVDQGGVLASGEAEAVSFEMTSSELPRGRFDVAAERMDAEVRLPLFSDAPQDFRYRVAIEGVTLGDAVWDVLDAGRVLPREPGSLVVDVGGRMGLDLFAIIAAAEAGGMPAAPRVESVELRTLAIKGLGARMAASGAVDIGPDFLPSGGGVITLEGVDGLLDAAVALGLATPQDLVPVRLGLASFFDPGEGGDVLSSRVAIEGMAVTMNGVPLPLD